VDVPPGDYTQARFREMLVKSQERFVDLREVSFLTKFAEWGNGEPYTLSGFLKAHNFEVIRHGEIRELSTFYTPPDGGAEIFVNYFASLNPENRILTCFTKANRHERQKTINSLVGEIGIYYLWINPIAFDEIKNSILSEYQYAKILHFVADRKQTSRPPASFRPEVKRTLTYWGEDGRESLEELRHYYGVLPRYVEFRIPGVVGFSLDHLGVFHYKNGSLKQMFNYSREAARLVLEVRRILEQAKLEVLDVETARKHLKVQNIVPWEIHFKRDLDISDAELLLELLEQKNFAVYNQAVTQGSLYLDATVFDEKKQSVFSISSNQHRMIVSPRYNTTFDSFFRFFEAITDSFDPEASCRAPAR